MTGTLAQWDMGAPLGETLADGLTISHLMPDFRQAPPKFWGASQRWNPATNHANSVIYCTRPGKMRTTRLIEHHNLNRLKFDQGSSPEIQP